MNPSDPQSWRLQLDKVEEDNRRLFRFNRALASRLASASECLTKLAERDEEKARFIAVWNVLTDVRLDLELLAERGVDVAWIVAKVERVTGGNHETKPRRPAG